MVQDSIKPADFFFLNLRLLCPPALVFFSFVFWGGMDAMKTFFSFFFNLFLHQKLQYWSLKCFFLCVEIPTFDSIQYWGKRRCFLGDSHLYSCVAPIPEISSIVLWSTSCFLWPFIISLFAPWFLKFFSGELIFLCYLPLGQKSTHGGLVHLSFQRMYHSYVANVCNLNCLLQWMWRHSQAAIFTLLPQDGLLHTGSRLQIFQDVAEVSPSHLREYIWVLQWFCWLSEVKDSFSSTSHVKIWILSSKKALILALQLLNRYLAFYYTDLRSLIKQFSQSFIKISLYIPLYYVRMHLPGSYSIILWKLNHKNIKQVTLMYWLPHKEDSIYSLLGSYAFVSFHKKEKERIAT